MRAGKADPPVQAEGKTLAKAETGMDSEGVRNTLHVHAYAFATTFRLRELIDVFSDAETEHDKDCLVARYKGDAVRIAVLFDFGSVVTIGLSPDERERLVVSIGSRIGPEPHSPLTEDFLVEVRSGAKVEVQFDRVILAEATVPALKVISLVLAQSAAMDYYDEDVQEIQQRTDVITRALQSEGRIPGRLHNLVKFIGSCIETKNGMIATLALFDKPDATWEDQQIDRLYGGLRVELEIDDRFRALEAKLRMIQENLVLLADLYHSRSAWRLELTVVLLILFEILLNLWNLFHGGTHT
jgi:uncharacterized Rmd1/YagE family protein